MADIDKCIAEEFVKIEENYTYLGVLKSSPLMEAMMAFENAFARMVDLLEITWQKQEMLPREQLFVELGEDYSTVKNLNHADDALEPIYDGIRQVYEYMAQFRDSGMSLEEGREKLIAINESRK